MAIFFRGYLSDFFGLNLPQANTFSSFWTSPYENEKSSLVLGARFSRKIESRFLPYVFENFRPRFNMSRFWKESRFHVFDWTAGNIIERPLNRDDFYRVLYDTLPRNGEWSERFYPNKLFKSAGKACLILVSRSDLFRPRDFYGFDRFEISYFLPFLP